MVVFQNQSLNQIEFSLICQLLEGNNMFWLHCNGCYCQPEPGVVLRFYITNCSHIYCEKCVTACTKECCKVCQSQCTTLELSGKLQKEVENLFDEPVNVLQRAVKQATQTIEFQKSHQRRWCRHLKEVVSNSVVPMYFCFNDLKTKRQSQQFKDVKKLVTQYQNMERELMELKKENSYLKCLLSKSDPGNRSGSRNGPYSAGASPNQSVFGRSTQQSMPMSQLNRTQSRSSSDVLNRPGRLLMRTPPSGGQLGTTRSRLTYGTPGSVETMRKTSVTPLTVPRPICLSHTE